jgi:hypothetical protein
VSEHLASRHPEKLIGLHVTYSGYYQAPPQDQLSQEERRYVQQVQARVMREGGYALVQATRPQTQAFALNDSAAGLAAWLADKFRAWTDCDGDIERCFTKDELLAHVMLYWVTDTIGSSMRTYLENPPHKFGERLAPPAAFASFPKDISPPRANGWRDD